MVGKERHCMSVPFRDECCIVKHPIPHRAESTVCLIIFGANLLKINKAISYNEPIQREMVFRFLSFHFMKLKILHLKRKEENRLSRSKGTGICSVPSCRGERERERQLLTLCGRRLFFCFTTSRVTLRATVDYTAVTADWSRETVL